MNWWGKSWGATGWALLGYDWVYTPLCKLWGFEPWSVTSVGVLMAGLCLLINLFQLAIGEAPIAGRALTSQERRPRRLR